MAPTSRAKVESRHGRGLGGRGAPAAACSASCSAASVAVVGRRAGSRAAGRLCLGDCVVGLVGFVVGEGEVPPEPQTWMRLMCCGFGTTDGHR